MEPIKQVQEPKKRTHVAVHHHHVSLAFVLFIVIVVIMIIVIKPAFIGYRLSKDFQRIGLDIENIMSEFDNLKSEVLFTETQLQSCKIVNNESFLNLRDEKNKSYLCQSEKQRLLSDIDQLQREYSRNITEIEKRYQQNKSQAELELNQLKIDYQNFILRFDSIVGTSANNICCKNRIDNPNIDSYIVTNDRIVCTIGEADKIVC